MSERCRQATRGELPRRIGYGLHPPRVVWISDQPSQQGSGRCDRVRVCSYAVLGGGPMWDEPPFYRVFDAVLDNEGDAVFLVNGGDGELIRYDIGSGRTSRIGRRGAGPGEFGRPVWLEPHGPDSLLAYDMSLGRFSVFSRSGDFGRIFMLPGDGGRGRHVAAVTRMGARVWAALSLGTPPGLMGLETPPGTKARDTVAVLELTPEGGASNTVARVPHGLWERGPDTRSFELIRDKYTAWATIAGGGGRLFVATFGGDSLEVSAYRAGDDAGELSRYAVELAGCRGAACAGCSRAGRDRCGSSKRRTTPRCFTCLGSRGTGGSGREGLPSAGPPGFWMCRGTGLCFCSSTSWTGRRWWLGGRAGDLLTAGEGEPVHPNYPLLAFRGFLDPLSL